MVEIMAKIIAVPFKIASYQKAARACCWLTSLFFSLILTQDLLARDTVQIVGSSTVYPYSERVLMKMAQQGDNVGQLVSTGTAGGFKLLCAGKGDLFPDISNASREIKPQELVLCRKRGISKLHRVKIGFDGIVLISDKASSIDTLSRAQLWQAFADQGDQPTHWRDIDSRLPNVPIELWLPPESSGTRDAWDSLVMSKACSADVRQSNASLCAELRKDGVIRFSGENDRRLVERIKEGNNLLAIVGFSYYKQNIDDLKAVKIDDITPSFEAIQAFDYPLSRALFFYVKPERLSAVPQLGLFIKNFLSDDAVGASGFLVKAGLIPLSAEDLYSERQQLRLLKRRFR